MTKHNMTMDLYVFQSNTGKNIGAFGDLMKGSGSEIFLYEESN